MSVEAIPPWRIGVDIGGTFTDLVLVDANGAVHIAKTPTTPADPSEGVMRGLAILARDLAMAVPALLGRCALFIHGTTIATNTVLERKGARVGLLATEGFRDTLEIRRGFRDAVWDHRTPWPDVLVPRRLRATVPERIDRHGTITRPLDTNAVAAIVERFRQEGIEAIAICLLNSFLNDAHERDCQELIQELWPEVWISRSSGVAPIIGEYERSSTTVVDAYVGPRVMPYLRNLETRLCDSGLVGRLHLVQSNGGIVSVDQVAERPINLILSGPAAGVGAIDVIRRASGSDHLICIEVGGTSCDVTLMRDGEIAMADQLHVGGYHVTVPSVEIHTIGGGGGTIAGVDDGGMLWVGPQGAGSKPGPACYGLGGTEPTVTDAQLILGRLKSGRYAGGSITLDLNRAVAAVERRVARPLGIDVTAAAAGIIRLLEQNIQHAIERVSIERGYDPRQFVLVPGGGAGAMHAATVARALGCKSVYVPKLAGVFCAFGMCNSDVRHDYLQTWFGTLEQAHDPRVEAAFTQMEAKAGTLLRADGFQDSEIVLQRGFDLRYWGQQSSIPIVLAPSVDPVAVRAAFEARYHRLYGHAQPDGTIEIVNLRLVATGRLNPIELTAVDGTPTAPTPYETRAVYVDATHGSQEIAIYDGSAMRCHQAVAGPAIIEEPTTTVFLGHGDSLHVDAYGNYAITFDCGQPA